MRYKVIAFVLVILGFASVHLAEAQDQKKTSRLGVLTGGSVSSDSNPGIHTYAIHS
jgi:hypothetical protein